MIPVLYEAICAMALQIIGGLLVHEKTLGLKQITAEILRLSLEDVQARQRAYQAALGERPQLLTVVRQEADQESRSFINASKKVLRYHLGDQWNQGWSEAGFLEPTIKTPTKLSGRETLLQALAAYFKAHPEQQSADFGVTAERASELHQAMSAARDDLQNYMTRRTDLKADRDKAVAVLRKRLRAVVAELTLLLESDSSLWAAFGLTAPAQQGIRKKNSAQAGESEGGSAVEGNAGSLASEDSKVIPMAA